MKNAYRLFLALLVLTLSSLAYADPNNPYQVSDATSADDIVPLLNADANRTVQVLSTSGSVYLYSQMWASDINSGREGLIIGGGYNYPSINAITNDLNSIKQTTVLDGYLTVDGYEGDGSDNYLNNNLTVSGGNVSFGKNNIAMGNGANVNISDGSLSFYDNFYVGSDSAATFVQTGGSVTLSQYYEAPNLVVGYNAGSDGKYAMSGGTLTVDGLILGENASSKGTATFNNYVYASVPNNIHVGRGGAGTLTVDGASLESTSGYLYIGTNEGGSGEVTLQNNATLSVPNHSIRVGQAGTGVLNIQSGSSFSGIEIYLGYEKSGNGTFNVDNGSVSSNGIYVGDYGTGTLNANSSTMEIKAGGFYIGGAEDTTNKPAGTGTATLTNTSLAVPGDIAVGNYGIGTLTLDGSGTTLTTSGYLYVANHTGATGTLTLQNGAKVSLPDHTARIGQSGTAVVNVLSGATLDSSARDFHMAYNASGEGTLNIDGGTVLTQNVIGGRNGTAEINLISGTLDTSAAKHVYLGNNAGSKGTLNMSGGTLNCGDLRVGDSGTGIANITGGTATVNLVMYAGIYNGANGTINVSGADTNIAVTGNITIAYDTGSTGVMNFNGGTVTGNSELLVGRNGNGTMNIDGGNVTVSGLVNVGYADGATGKVTIKNGTLTSTYADKSFRIGRAGTGTIEVLEGGNLIVNNSETQLGYSATTGYGKLKIKGGSAQLHTLQVGYAAESTGYFEMTSGTLDITNSEINVGYNGYGYAKISGGVVNLNSLRVGRESGSFGQLTIDGNGVMNLTSAARISFNAGSEGRVFIKDNGQLNVTKELTIGNSDVGYVEVSGGQVNANPIVIKDNGSKLTMTGGMVTTPTITIPQVDSLDWSGGGLDVETVNGNLIQKGGVLYPGISTIVAAEIVGSYTQSSEGEVVIDVDQLNNVWDTITVSGGDLDLNGTLFVNFAQDVEPADTYQIFIVPNGNLDVADLSLEFPDWYSYARMWSLNADGKLVFGADPGPGPGPGPGPDPGPGPGPGTGVPEPSTWALLALGIIGLFLRKRVRN